MLVWKKAPGEISQLQPAHLLAQALLAEHAGRPVAVAGVAGDDRVQVDGRFREARLGGDQAGLDLAAAPALAHDQVAEDAAALAAVVGRSSLQPRPVAHLVAGGVAGLGGEVAVVDVDDQVPAPAGVEAEHRLPVLARAEGVLELVAVAPLLLGG